MKKISDIKWLEEPAAKDKDADRFHRPCAVSGTDGPAIVPCKIV